MGDLSQGSYLFDEGFATGQASLFYYQEMVEDLMAIVHTFSCRLDGMRKYKNAIHTDFPQYTLQPPKDELQ